jgi:arylsulfatase A-like enzyme
VLLALGIAARAVPVLERHAVVLQRVVRHSLPLLAALVPILGACLWGADQLRAWREAHRPLPPPGAANLVLIVLDTVGADHLSLHGYARPTSPTLEDLASRGIRFDRAQATSSWTLPSHASMFTGRWPHELSVGWFTPLDRTYPTLAEFLGARGYATAGFIANSWYCGSDSGLARGFTAYQDYTFPRLTAFKTTVLVDRLLEGLEAMESWLEDWLDFDRLSPAVDRLWWLFKNNRKAAGDVAGEFLDWLSRRPQPERPFFAFLNLYDAHYPYELPEKRLHRFGARPRNDREANLLRDWLRLIQEGPSPRQIGYARDAYDDCVADLDEQLGRLIDELEGRPLLERTWVIITADHGESFGEQPGVFWHGTSLYQAQVHVPLVVIPPPGGPSPGVVTEPVSLRDLPATIVEVLGWGIGSPIPGESLARCWGGSSPASVPSRGTVLPAADDPRRDDRATEPAASAPVLAELVPIPSFDQDPAQWLRMPRWPMAALTLGDWTYIRREGDIREELFHLREDAQEWHNRAGDPALQPVLERMRETLGRLTAGPLNSQRFNP